MYTGNPNGAHQWWGKWTFEVSCSKGFSKSVTMEELKQNFGRFCRKLFGSNGVADVRWGRGKLTIDVLVEGGNVAPHDPYFVEYVRNQATAFMVNGFGPNARVQVAAKLMAGSRQDGTPAEQMLIVPCAHIFSTSEEFFNGQVPSNQ
jgi:hypothetical protein